jgi:hypothetical protein
MFYSELSLGVHFITNALWDYRGSDVVVHRQSYAPRRSHRGEQHGNMYVETKWPCRGDGKRAGVTKFSDEKPEGEKL